MNTSPARRWSTVFRKSQFGENTWFLKGSRWTHSGYDADSLEGQIRHLEFRLIIESCRRHGLLSTHDWAGGPGSACSFQIYFAFLDGGVFSFSGDYGDPRHGVWVLGHEAFRFVCLELGLEPRAMPVRTLARSGAELRAAVTGEIDEKKEMLEDRLSEMRRKYWESDEWPLRRWRG